MAQIILNDETISKEPKKLTYFKEIQQLAYEGKMMLARKIVSIADAKVKKIKKKLRKAALKGETQLRYSLYPSRRNQDVADVIVNVFRKEGFAASKENCGYAGDAYLSVVVNIPELDF